MGNDAIVSACANPMPEIWPSATAEAGARISIDDHQCSPMLVAGFCQIISLDARVGCGEAQPN
jgi:hypothetical protein